MNLRVFPIDLLCPIDKKKRASFHESDLNKFRFFTTPLQYMRTSVLLLTFNSFGSHTQYISPHGNHRMLIKLASDIFTTRFLDGQGNNFGRLTFPLEICPTKFKRFIHRILIHYLILLYFCQIHNILDNTLNKLGCLYSQKCVFYQV